MCNISSIEAGGDISDCDRAKVRITYKLSCLVFSTPKLLPVHSSFNIPGDTESSVGARSIGTIGKGEQ